MKNNLLVRLVGRPASLLAIFASLAVAPASLRAADYSWTKTSASTWNVSTGWANVVGGGSGVPGVNDNIIAYVAGAGSIEFNSATPYAINNISNTTAGLNVSFIDLTANSTLNLSGTLIESSANGSISFRRSSTELSVNAANVLVTSGTLNLGVSATTQMLNSFSSAGTTTVNGGALNFIMGNFTTGMTSASLNSLVVNSGTVDILNDSATSVVLASGISVNSLAGTGGLIELNAISGASKGDTGTLTINSTANSEYDGAIADGVSPGASSKMFLSLIKNGAFTQTLTGALTYTGTTVINAGSVQIGNGGANGSLASNTVLNSGTLGFDLSAASTYAGNITGSGALVQLGSGTTSLTGANTFTGTTTVSNGGLQIGTGGAAGSLSGNVSIQNGASFIISRTGTLAYAGTVSGSNGIFQKNNSGMLVLQGASTFSGTTQITSLGSTNSIMLSNANALQNSTVSVAATNGLQFDTVSSTYTIGGLAGSSNFVLTDTNSNPITLQIGNNGGNSTYSGNLTGSGSLAQIGGGASILTGSNTFGGSTTVSNGTLQVGAGSSAGYLSSNVSIQNSGAFTIARTGTITYGGLISGSTGSFNKANSGTLILQAASTFSGTTSILGGAANNNITLSNANALQNSTVSVLVTNGLRFDTVASTFSIGGLAGSGNFVLTDTSSNPITLQVGSNNGNSSYSGNLTGSGAIQKVGTGTLTLVGDESNAGQTIVSSGVLAVGQGGGSGTLTSDVAIQNGATFAISRTGTFAYAGVISGTDGIFQKNNSATLILQAASTFSGTTQITSVGGTNNILLSNANALQNSSISMTATNGLRFDTVASTYTIGALQGGVSGLNTYGFVLSDTTGAAIALRAGNNGASTTFSGVISGPGSFEKIGGGTMTFAGDQTYAGTTTVSGGGLQLGNGGTSGSVSGDILNNSAVIFNRSDAPAYGGSISGTGSVTIAGPGSVTFTAGNSYSGPTTVAAGQLIAGNISGSVTGQGAVTVQANASLAGTGFIAPGSSNSVIVQAGGTIAPGIGGAGTLTIDLGSTSGNVSMLDQSSFAFTLGASNATTSVNFFNYSTGALSLGNTVYLNFANAQVGTFNLMSFFSDSGTNPFSGSVDISEFDLLGLSGFNSSLAYSSGVVTLTLTAIPEPASNVLMILAGIGIAMFWRKRRAC